MKYATFNYADVVMIFADQFQTLAVYHKTNKTAQSFILYDIAGKKQNYFRISLNSKGELAVSGYTGSTALAWFPCKFDVTNDAADVWQVGSSIVVGMGDIRGVSKKKPDYHEFDLGINDILITSKGMFNLQFYRETKTPAPKSKKEVTKKTTRSGKTKSVVAKKK